MKPGRLLSVVQHTSADYLGLMEDHLEGRGIAFKYYRPFTEGAEPPHPDEIGDGLVLLGGGPWGAAGVRDVPTLAREITLARTCLMLEKPLVGIGLGAQILALAAGGTVDPGALTFEVETAHRTDPQALNGYLPAQFPLPVYMRDTPVPPDYARLLAAFDDGKAAVFQIGATAFGFCGHPGFKPAMAEDLIMEFDEAPPDPVPTLARLRTRQGDIEDALVPIMTGLIQLTGLMAGRDRSGPL